MRWTFLVFAVLAMVRATFASGTQAPEPLKEPAQVTLCDIKAHPEQFVHKFVQFTATASYGFEDSMVEDEACTWRDTRRGVWMEYGGTQSTDTMYCCGFAPKPDREKPITVDGIVLPLVDDKAFQNFNKRLHKKHRRRQDSNTVRATLRGYVFARYEGVMGTQSNPDWRGYGHMGCCMLFVVTQVVAPDPPASSKTRD